MADYNQDWDDLGKNIQDIIDRAVNSHDFQKLEQTIRQAVETGSEAIRSAANTVEGEVVREKKNLPVLYRSTADKTTKGVLKVVGGGIVTFFSTVALGFINGFLPSLAGAIVPVAGLVAGIWLICGGADALGMAKRFKAYRKALGEKTHCSLEKLARSVGKSIKFVRRDLKLMIKEGLFIEGHLDKEGQNLITSDETYRNFEQHRLQLEQRQRQEAADKAKKEESSHSPQVQEVLDKGNAFILEIRRCNDAIPGEEISAKIDRMENIVRRIFERAESHPEIVPDLKKLMDYYLPMTVKLLNAYADMDAQPVQGQNIANSKREIEATLDTLNLAFEKLLDSVFEDTALDISSDISVLNTLLAQEGLTEDDLTKMKKSQTL